MSDRRDGQSPLGSNYPAVGAVIIGLALGIAAAAVTRQAALMLAGLALGAAVAVWLSRRDLDGKR
jgi:hypothetical protein